MECEMGAAVVEVEALLFGGHNAGVTNNRIIELSSGTTSQPQ